MELLQRGKSVKHKRTVQQRWAACKKVGLALVVSAVVVAGAVILQQRFMRSEYAGEAAAMLDSVMSAYLNSLTEGERKIYNVLTEHYQDTFRICRDLALLTKHEHEPFSFFLSFNHLADRLGIHPTQAQRIMQQLESFGLIKLLKKGTRREKGSPGLAGTYQMAHFSMIPEDNQSFAPTDEARESPFDSKK